MYGIFVNENGGIPYAELITHGLKKYETRNRNMLKNLIGEHVAIIRTHRNKHPMIVGYATISDYMFCPADCFEYFRPDTFIPVGSKYDVHGKGKWLYEISNARQCYPRPLPENAIRHGRSYCEF